MGVFKRDIKTNNLTLDKMISTPHKNDNVKNDKDTKTITSGSIVYTWGALSALLNAPTRSAVGVGGLTEYGRDPKS